MSYSDSVSTTLISKERTSLTSSSSAQHIHLDQHGYPPPNPSAPRIIMSPGHHHKPHPHMIPSSHSHLHPHQQHHPHHAHSRRPHSRSSSRSSSASLDVDEMLLEATTADAINGITANQPPPPPHMASLPLPTTTTSQNGSPHLRSHHPRRHAEKGSSRRVHVYQGQQAQEGAGYAYPANQSVPRKELSSGVALPGGQQPGPLVQPGQVQQYQTHVFAPVVTGAPMKKPKYSVSGSSIGGGGSVSALTAGPGGPAGGKCSFWPLDRLVEERTSPVRSLASGNFPVFLPTLLDFPCVPGDRWKLPTCAFVCYSFYRSPGSFFSSLVPFSYTSPLAFRSENSSLFLFNLCLSRHLLSILISDLFISRVTSHNSSSRSISPSRLLHPQ